MTKLLSILTLACTALLTPAPIAAAQEAPLSLVSARVSIAGTSNIHEFTASTTDVRVTKVALASGVAGLAAIVNPGAVEAFEIAVRAKSLTSPKDGLDKNMHKALKVTEHPEIVFRLTQLVGKTGAIKAIGMLSICGVEREVAFDLKTAAAGSTLTVSGEVPLLMTDYGVTPPKAMLGMLKTDPKVTVKFEAVLAIATTF